MQSPSVFLLTALGALVICQGAASTTPTRADRAEPHTAAAALTQVYVLHADALADSQGTVWGASARDASLLQTQPQALWDDALRYYQMHLDSTGRTSAFAPPTRQVRVLAMQPTSMSD